MQNSTEIANDVWGNYSDVDYRKSGPKLVCMYSGRGSTTPSGPKDFRYGDDAIDMLKPSKIPFLEDQAGKKDQYGLLVALPTPKNYIEAEMLKQKLMAADIRVNLTQTFDGPALMVFERDFKIAQAVLKS